MNSQTKTNKRILALDILRGVTIAGMIMVNNPGTWGHIYAPLRHAEWNGLTPTDLVFPFFMFIMGILVLAGLVGRLGKYLPSQSIAGFLLVIGFALTFAPNLSAVTQTDEPMSGYIALGVTAWSKNPFLGMVVGVLVRYLGVYVGLV